MKIINDNNQRVMEGKPQNIYDKSPNTWFGCCIDGDNQESFEYSCGYTNINKEINKIELYYTNLCLVKESSHSIKGECYLKILSNKGYRTIYSDKWGYNKEKGYYGKQNTINIKEIKISKKDIKEIKFIAKGSFQPPHYAYGAKLGHRTKQINLIIGG